MDYMFDILFSLRLYSSNFLLHSPSLEYSNV